MTNSFHTVTVEKAAEAYVLSRGRVRFSPWRRRSAPSEH